MSVGNSGVIFVTGGYDNTIKFWEASKGICYRSMSDPDSQANRLAISNDKTRVAVAGNPTVRIYDVIGKSTNPIKIDGHKSNVTALGFCDSPKFGSTLWTASEDSHCCLWDFRPKNIRPVMDHKASASLYCAAMHPNQTEIISGDQDGRISVWDLRGGRSSSSSSTAAGITSESGPSKEIRLPEGTGARALAISADGERLAVANNKGKVFVYKLGGRDAGPLSMLCSWQAHDTYILQCAFSPNGNVLATASADTTIKLWSPQETLEPAAAATAAAAGDAAAGAGAGGSSGSVDVTKKWGYALAKTLVGHKRWVWDVVFSSDGNYLMSGSSDHSARLWDVKTAQTVKDYLGHTKAITCVALHDSVFVPNK